MLKSIHTQSGDHAFVRKAQIFTTRPYTYTSTASSPPTSILPSKGVLLLLPRLLSRSFTSHQCTSRPRLPYLHRTTAPATTPALSRTPISLLSSHISTKDNFHTDGPPTSQHYESYPPHRQISNSHQKTPSVSQHRISSSKEKDGHHRRDDPPQVRVARRDPRLSRDAGEEAGDQAPPLRGPQARHGVGPVLDGRCRAQLGAQGRRPRQPRHVRQHRGDGGGEQGGGVRDAQERCLRHVGGVECHGCSDVASQVRFPDPGEAVSGASLIGVVSHGSRQSRRSWVAQKNLVYRLAVNSCSRKGQLPARPPVMSAPGIMYSQTLLQRRALNHEAFVQSTQKRMSQTLPRPPFTRCPASPRPQS